MSDDLQNICLQSLWPRGCHPAKMLGRFNSADELTFVRAPDMDFEAWRDPDESAEAFSQRVANAILARRGLPSLPEPLERVEALHKNAAAPEDRQRLQRRPARPSDPITGQGGCVMKLVRKPLTPLDDVSTAAARSTRRATWRGSRMDPRNHARPKKSPSRRLPHVREPSLRRQRRAELLHRARSRKGVVPFPRRMKPNN